MRLGGLITLALAGTLIAAPAHAQTADRTVSIGNNAFSPAELTITQGEVVNWVWTGPDKNHSTTTSGEGQTTWDSDPLDPTPEPPEGDRFSKEFPYEGTFEYYCKTHPTTMLGRIIVVGQDRNAFPPAPDVDPPEFGTLRVSAKRRWIRFRLNENASVVGRMRGPMRRTLKLSGKLGTNVMRLPKRLKKGRYGVNLRATDAAGNESLVARVKFTLR